MILTSKEKEIMTVLWKSPKPLTAAEIIEITPNRTFCEGSIFGIMSRLTKKGAVTLELYKPTAGKHAGAYKPVISREDYAMGLIEGLNNSGISLDFDVLGERIKNAGKGRRNGD